MTIQQIPKDLLKTIFSYLPSIEIMKNKCICRSWKAIAEEVAKVVLIKEFEEMVDRTSKLFQIMTCKKVYEFISNPTINLDFKSLSYAQANERLKSSVLKLDFHLEINGCSICEIQAETFTIFMKKYSLNVSEDKLFLHLNIGGRGGKQFVKLKEGDPLYDELCIQFHFPIELFAIKENQETCFPFKGRLVILRAKQTQSSSHYENDDSTFEKALEICCEKKKAPDFLGFHAHITTFYIWQKDAYAP